MFKCQSCGNTKCVQILDLGKQPICNRFIRSTSEFKNEKLYPLQLVYCTNCTLVQLGTLLPGALVFGKDFNYLSGSTPDVVQYFSLLAARLTRRFNLSANDMVLDIGSNDGTFLKNFSKMGFGVLGVQPTLNPHKEDIEHSADTIIRP